VKTALVLLLLAAHPVERPWRVGDAFLLDGTSVWEVAATPTDTGWYSRYGDPPPLRPGEVMALQLESLEHGSWRPATGPASATRIRTTPGRLVRLPAGP
jgi:hypothetical protein